MSCGRWESEPELLDINPAKVSEILSNNYSTLFSVLFFNLGMSWFSAITNYSEFDEFQHQTKT